MEEKKIKVRILPLHNIGGVGNAGDDVWMSKADAEMYMRDGYVEAVEEKTLTPDPSPDGEGEKTPSSPPAPLPMERGDVVEDHAIMKPQNRRSRKK